MNILECFGKNLKELRIKRGLSQEELAELANVHRTYISFLERGLRNPSLLKIEKLANVLDVPYDFFFRGEE